MAIEWGGWEDSGGKGMRVGIDVTRTAGDGSPVDHNSGSCKFTVEFYTENRGGQFDGDTQTLNLGGAFSGSITFSNSQLENSAVKRDTRVELYTYGALEYGSSPGNKTFQAVLAGASNGITPGKQRTEQILARPYGVPLSPTGVSATRVSDTASQVSWTRRSTAGEPYSSQVVQRSVSGLPYITVATVAGTASTYTDSSVIPNSKYLYRVSAGNTAGSSGYATSGTIWTSPAPPTSCVRTTSGADQVITWVNGAGYIEMGDGYAEYATELWHAADGVWDSAPLQTLGPGVVTATHTAPSATIKHKYQVRAATTSGILLYSEYSEETSETAGIVSTPDAPTGLNPSGGVVVNYLEPVVVTWQHNATDSSFQTTFKMQFRIAGSGTWTPIEADPAKDDLSSYTFAAPDSFSPSTNYEWQVATQGASATWSAWSASAFFSTQTATPLLYPLYLNPTSGRMEADHNGGGSVPIGAMMMWPTATAPPNWLICNGNAIPMQYTTLITLIGANTPDYRDVFPVGASATKTVLTGTGGSNKITSAHLPVHTHSDGTLMTAAVGNHTHASFSGTTGGSANATIRAAGTGGGDVTTKADGAHPALDVTGATGDGGFANNDFLPSFRAINFIIKAA